MRYVQKRPPVVLQDIATGEDSTTSVTFDQVIRLVCAAVAQKASADALSLIDIRAKFSRASEMDYVELTDDEHAAITPEFKRPTAMSQIYTMSAEDHIRAVLDAPTKRP